MNIEDVTARIEIPENPVAEIFGFQRKLMEKYDVIETKNGLHIPSPPWHLDNVHVQARLKDMFWRTTEELAEAVEDVPPPLWLADWKKTWDNEASIRHFFEELADALHFLVEASIIAGLTPDKVSAVFNPEVPMPAYMSNTGQEVLSRVSQIIFSLGLAANTLKNKPWKQSQMPTDRDKFESKLMEAWSNFETLWESLGCSMSDVYILYAKKKEVNHWRQDTNY